MKFAIIETGGKQYHVKEGDIVTIEKLSKLEKKGDTVVFDKVLLVDDGKTAQIGDPYLKGAKVEGSLESVGRAKKIEMLRYKAKSNRMRRQGHRQPFMKVKIETIK